MPYLVLQVHALRIGLVLDMTARNLERVIYYEDYLVIDPGNTPLEAESIAERTSNTARRGRYGAEAFVAKMGAEAVREALRTRGSGQGRAGVGTAR